MKKRILSIMLAITTFTFAATPVIASDLPATAITSEVPETAEAEVPAVEETTPEETTEAAPETDVPEETAEEPAAVQETPALETQEAAPAAETPSTYSVSTVAPDIQDNSTLLSDETEVYVYGTFYWSYITRMLELVNQFRAENGREPLQLDSGLCNAAMLRAAEISMYYNKSHLRPNGSSFVSASSQIWGENIATVSFSADVAADVFDSWINSAGHRENILRDNMYTVGFGFYQGSGTDCVSCTQEFGRTMTTDAVYDQDVTAATRLVSKDDTNHVAMIWSKNSASSLSVGGSGTLSIINPFEITVPDGPTTGRIASWLAGKWETSDSSVATVEASFDSKGAVVKAVGPGTCKITYALSKNIKLEREITVGAPLTSIAMDKKTLEVEKGQSGKLAVNYFPSATTDDKTVTWSSDNEAVATVDKDGTVSGKSTGTCVITAKVGNFTATSTVTVKHSLTGISIPSTAELNVGGTKKLNVTYSPADTTDDKSVIWKSGKESVATVDADGVVTAKAAGEAVITATVGKFTSKCKVTVKKSELPMQIQSSKIDILSKSGNTVKAKLCYTSNDDKKNIDFHWLQYDLATQQWSEIQEWTKGEDTVTWNIKKPGNYWIYCEAKTSTGNSTTQCMGYYHKEKNVQITGIYIPSAKGNNISAGLCYTSDDELKDLSFRWLQYDLAKQEWSEIQDWTKGNNWVDWHLVKPGNYWIYCEVKTSTGNTTNYCNGYYYSGNKIQSTGIYCISNPKDNSYSAGLCYTSDEGMEDISFRWLQYDLSKQEWSEVQGWTKGSNWVTWKQTKPGNYWIHCEARTSTGNSTIQCNGYSYEGKRIQSSGIYVPSTSGKTISAGLCYTSDDDLKNISFRWLQYDLAKQEWSEIQDWTKGSNWVDWTPKRSGNYWIYCEAKTSTGNVTTQCNGIHIN